MNFELESSSEERAICQSVEGLSCNNNEKNTVQPVDSGEGKGLEDLHETVNQMTNFMKTKDFSSMLSRFKNFENYTKSNSKEQDGIHPRFFIRCLVELDDYIREVWDNRKILAKKNREDLDSVKKKLQKISKIFAHDLAKYRENPDLDADGEKSDSKKFKNERGNNDVIKNINENASPSKKSTSEEAKCVKVDSSDKDEPMLPYDPDVDTFGDRILKIGSSRLTYEQAFMNPTYRDMALHLKKSSSVPIKFTQFVLKELAVDAVRCPSFVAALHPRAEEYLQKLIGPKDSKMRQVHPENCHERPSSFRGHFTKLFCRKVISNIQNVYCDVEKFNKLARVFPFKIRKNVPEYEINILNNFDEDESFYIRMQNFLNDHFDKKVPVRETTTLFLNNIRHFFETTFSPEQRFQYLKKFRSLNDAGIVHFQNLYTEYRNVRKQCYDCKSRVPNCYYDDEDLRKIPEKNFDQLASLLDPVLFLSKPDTYNGTFEKCLFFFVHALEVENGPVFFIDSMLYQCLKSLHRFRTLRQDINIVDDIAMITLLCFLGSDTDFRNIDAYSLNSTTLQNIKSYITTFVSKESKNVQFNFEYKTELFCEIPFRVDSTCFDVCYASKKNNCQRGIMNFLRQLLSSALSQDYDPITDIVCYSAYLGQESRFEINQDIIESVRNFVRLSTKRNIAEVSPPTPPNNIYLHLLRNRLT